MLEKASAPAQVLVLLAVDLLLYMCRQVRRGTAARPRHPAVPPAAPAVSRQAQRAAAPPPPSRSRRRSLPALGARAPRAPQLTAPRPHAATAHGSLI